MYFDKSIGSTVVWERSGAVSTPLVKPVSGGDTRRVTTWVSTVIKLVKLV